VSSEKRREAVFEGWRLGSEEKMVDAEKQDRGQLRVDVDECKGCGLCVEACPPKLIGMSERLNHYGYRTATYVGKGCTGCGICFVVCPEPGAITVLRLVKKDTAVVGASVCASN
jgi:Pyruvate/2-oxoacid:ferredoxin oxidoreductase delta subunit